MIEKMLHALPGIKRIYVLIRPSKGKSGADRWNELVKVSSSQLSSQRSHLKTSWAGHLLKTKQALKTSQNKLGWAPELGIFISKEETH